MCMRCVEESAGPERMESDRKLSRQLAERPFLMLCIVSAAGLLAMNIHHLY